ncbi:FecCD family ABC transporter permease [Desulfosediminicola ganghwensis]|uniref:FecCD family ABC transporter permease n=1 Tax=Desulfosediminicola ganghwensis TaxID=2569540 RepID=UPI0010AD852F|nr:iron chelate uptake ABC transporter family permease subunit [Desulfosediminicola ganghwensis]
MRGKAKLLFGSLITVLVAVIITATGMGYISISAADVIATLWQTLFDQPGLSAAVNTTNSVIIMDVRLPRILVAALVGGGLALAGGIFQAILLNPLADPYTLGISSGAAFGASTAFILSIIGISLPVSYLVPFFAFIGAVTTLGAVFYLSSDDPQLSSNTLILSGVIVAAILSAGIGFIKYMADEEVGVIIFWLMGSFIGKSWHDAGLLLLILAPCLLFCCYYARDLNIMALGTTTADTLGVDSAKIRRQLLISASLITAICVAVSGVIGFVGLIVPHMLRMITGPDNRILLPASFLAGSILLLVADTVTRAILPHEIPIGVLTALIGGPFFCYIFRKRQLGRGYA